MSCICCTCSHTYHSVIKELNCQRDGCMYSIKLCLMINTSTIYREHKNVFSNFFGWLIQWLHISALWSHTCVVIITRAQNNLKHICLHHHKNIIMLECNFRCICRLFRHHTSSSTNRSHSCANTYKDNDMMIKIDQLHHY